jgi:MFS family permease
LTIFSFALNSTELRAALSLAAVYVLRMLGLFMVMPVLAILAQDFDDFSPMLLGLAIGGYGLTQALLQIPMGILSDKVGRKPIIIGGLLLFALGSWLASSADSLLVLVVGRFLQGAGAIAGAIMALAGDVSRESQRSKVMAIIGISIGFSFYLALLLGPLIAKNYGLSGIFSITAVLALCCIPLVWLVVPNARNYAPSGDTLPVLQDVKNLYSDAQLARLNFGVFVLHLLITLLFVQLPTLLLAQDFSLDQQWSIYLPVLLASILGMGWLMSLARKKGDYQVIRIAIILLAVSCFGFVVLGHNFWGLMFACWLFFTGFNFLEANFPAMVSNVAPAGKKGSAMGIYASFQFFGAFCGGVSSGLLKQYFAAEWIFVFAGILCVIWFLFMRALNNTELLKRYTLPIEVSASTVQEMSNQLGKLAGVKDITIVLEQKVAYLKVDSKVFDLRAARNISKAEQSV